MNDYLCQPLIRSFTSFKISLFKTSFQSGSWGDMFCLDSPIVKQVALCPPCSSSNSKASWWSAAKPLPGLRRTYALSVFARAPSWSLKQLKDLFLLVVHRGCINGAASQSLKCNSLNHELKDLIDSSGFWMQPNSCDLSTATVVLSPYKDSK